MPSFTIVAASRLRADDFYVKSALGRSLTEAYANFPVKQKIYFENSKPLPVCYNDAIAGCTDPDEILMFVHDDILIVDYFWMDLVFSAFQCFDILGVAGNKRRVPRQPGWAFIDDRSTWDEWTNLSGVVGHGRQFPCKLSCYGPTGQSCKLLDGVFLASKKSILEQNGIRFDEMFDFHFYDLDFCRQGEQKNLRMGTIPLSIIHESEGNFGTPQWRRNYEKYLEKWKA
jgi:hypothetical protein